MPVSYEKNKQHIYNWRAKNIVTYSAYNKEYLKEYYKRTKGIDPNYSFDKIARIFRKIANVFDAQFD